MKKTITYFGVEKVAYEFTKEEILMALLEKYNIQCSYDYEFDLFEGDEARIPIAELIIKYKTVATDKEEKMTRAEAEDIVITVEVEMGQYYGITQAQYAEALLTLASIENKEENSD